MFPERTGRLRYSESAWRTFTGAKIVAKTCNGWPDAGAKRVCVLTNLSETNAEVGDPLPLAVRRSPLWRWATPVLSVAILIAVVFQLRSLDIAQLKALVPTNPLFWMVFVVYYFAGVIADFTIFRRLWGIPFEGFIALTRKLVSNELLLGYVGEVYFYSWARKKVEMSSSPFGAVKDVAILSALVGNGFTLAMMAVAYPLIGNLRLGIATQTILLSVGFVILISVLVIIFGKRLFSLTKSQLWMVAGVHFARIVATTGLAALAWSLALPFVALSWWIILATCRLLISRLPFLPNKDVVFAGVAVFLVGRDVEISQLMALMAVLMLSTHLVIGAALAIGDFVTVGEKAENKN